VARHYGQWCFSVLFEDRNGRIWVGLRPYFFYGLSLLVPDPQKDKTVVERTYTMEDGLPAEWILDLFESSDGKFWVGTTRGLCEWQGGETSVCKTYSAANELCDEEIATILEDKGKNLWMGTRCGVKKWTRYGFTSYDQSDGLGARQVNSIFENHIGELFVSFNEKGRSIGRFDGSKFESVKPNFNNEVNYFGWGWKQTVRQDRAGDWWFPGNSGLFHFSNPAPFENLPKSIPRKVLVGTKPTEVFRIFEDTDGNMWIATIGIATELWRWERASATWTDHTADVNFGSHRAGSAFVEDKSGNLWIGTGSDADDAALVRFRDGKFKVFAQREYPLLAGWMRDMYVDSKDRLWIADTVNGVLRLDDVNADQLNFTRYTPAEGLSSIAPLCITEDEFGRIYIGTSRGVDRLTPDTGQVEYFTTDDGLPNSNVDVAHRDRKNNLWFGTWNGLARFIPEPETIRRAPNTLITGFRVNGEAQSISVLGETEILPLELDSDDRQITVEFTGLAESLGEKIKYQYRFGESDWAETNERIVNFANLGADKYQFQVRAVTADRLNSLPATVELRFLSCPFEEPARSCQYANANRH